MRTDIGIPCLWSLHPHSTGPRDKSLTLDARQIAALADAGFEGVQLYRLQDVAPLRKTAIGIVTAPPQILPIARAHRDEGCDATTLVVGTGLESDSEIDRLFESVAEAARELSYPLFVETHRGTVTQDIRRTIDALLHHPEIMVTADFSHWYVGLEMRFGDFDARVEALSPLFPRVGIIHGRIGDSGSIQRPLDAPGMEQPIADMQRLWRLCIKAFIERAKPDEELIFSPQLLPPSVLVDGQRRWLHYGRVDEAGEEIGDRWSDAQKLTTIARTIFAEELAATGSPQTVDPESKTSAHSGSK